MTQLVSPLKVELEWGDVTQLVVGALVMGVPVTLTEEVWVLGETLPLGRILLIALASLTLLAFFIKVLFYSGDHLRLQLRDVIFTLGHKIKLLYDVIVTGSLLSPHNDATVVDMHNHKREGALFYAFAQRENNEKAHHTWCAIFCEPHCFLQCWSEHSQELIGTGC